MGVEDAVSNPRVAAALRCSSLKQCGVKCTDRLATSFGQRALAGWKEVGGQEKDDNGALDMLHGGRTTIAVQEFPCPCRITKI